jgi:flagellar capping protein FliD
MNQLTQTGTHIDQVRELMFGPQNREYSQRLGQLESTLGQLIEGTQKQFNEMQDRFTRDLQKAMASADKKIRALDLKTSEERAELRQRLEQMEEQYTTRFNTLEEDFSDFQEENRKRFETINDSQTNALQEVAAAANERMQGISSKMQEDVTDLRRQAKHTEEKLEFRVQALNEEIESSTTNMRQELSKIHKGAKDDLQELKAMLLDELEKNVRGLRDSKVSRDEMSEILFQFGMRIKGIDFGAGLSQLQANREVRAAR